MHAGEPTRETHADEASQRLHVVKTLFYVAAVVEVLLVFVNVNSTGKLAEVNNVGRVLTLEVIFGLIKIFDIEMRYFIFLETEIS